MGISSIKVDMWSPFWRHEWDRTMSSDVGVFEGAVTKTGMVPVR